MDKNKIRKKPAYYTLVALCIIGILIFSFEIINTMASIQYETLNPNHDCISLITGADLCRTIFYLKILDAICAVTLYVLLYFNKKILRKKKQ